MQFVIIVIVTIFSWFYQDYEVLSGFSFYAYILILIFDIIVNKKVSLLTIWNFAFFYIIVSESIVSEYYTDYHLNAYKYLLAANGIINLGFLTKSNNIIKNIKHKKEIFSNIKHQNIILIFIVLISIFFITRIERALYIFAVGRNVAYSEEYDGSMFSELIKAIGLVLPSILTYYFVIIKKKSLWSPLLYSSPIFLILFLSGTRFPLLFALIGTIIVYQTHFNNRISIKKYIIIGGLLGSLLISAEVMKHLRSSSTKNTKFSLLDPNQDVNESFPQIVAGFMTNEGIINGTASLFSYFNHHDYLYGQSSSFLFYFWVPRSIWQDKPTMLGHWLIRETSSGNVGSAHSASYGFTGDLYADFGWLSLIFIFLIGRALKYAESIKNYTLVSKTYSMVIGAMLYPYVFFFVRSPITATMNFIGVLVVYYIIKKFVFK